MRWLLRCGGGEEACETHLVADGGGVMRDERLGEGDAANCGI